MKIKGILGMHGALLRHWILLVLELLVAQCYISKANKILHKMSNNNKIINLGNKFDILGRCNFLTVSKIMSFRPSKHVKTFV